METDTIAYASNFSGLLLLWLSIVIGVLASVLVLRSAGKMGGGLFGSVLNFFGYGMIMVVVGSILKALAPWIPSFVDLGHTVFFSLGFILMVLGANKLLKGIMS